MEEHFLLAFASACKKRESASLFANTCDATGDEEYSDWSTDDEVTCKNTGMVATPTKQTSFPCSDCTRTFPTHSRMRDHGRAVHMPKRFKCPDCVKSFTYKCDVKRHQNRRHKKEPPLKRFKCPDCVKSFTYKCDMKRHHTKMHKEEPSL
jgi:predicted RNA-binding Zn-ribbon protein involved in translation (DUF1610 family)